MWQVIAKAPNYKINADAQVVNIATGRTMAIVPNNTGYNTVNLRIAKGVKRTLKLHRLVALAFVPNPDGKRTVNHKDGDRTNNKAENLEWCTQKENIHHSRRITRNGALISEKRVRELYKSHPDIPLELFVEMLCSRCK